MAKKLAKFDSSKHPRGGKGRFVETSDQPGLAKARVYGTDNSSRKASRKRLSKSQEAKLDEIILARASIRDSSKAGSDPLSKARVYGSDAESRKLLLSRMSKAQKLRLLAAFEIADKQKVETPVAATEASTKAKKEAEAVASVVAKAVDKVVAKTLAEAKAKTKRPKLTPEEKAAKEAEKQLAKQKARQEAEELAKKQEKAERNRRDAETVKERRLGSKIPAEYQELYEATLTATKAQILDNKAKGVKDPYEISVKRSPTSRPEPEKDSVTFTDTGLEIWQNKPHLGRFQASFKVRDNKNFEYAVQHDGQRLVLNRNHKVYEYGGETVEGIPDTHRNLKALKDQQLFDRLANSIRFTENNAKSNIVPPAPDWLHAYGTIDPKYVRSRKGVGKYGECQVHHVDQWAQQRFDEITSKLKYNPKTKRYEDSEITLEEAKTRMGELLVKVEKTDDNGKITSKYVIKTKPQSERRLVVLAAGTHDINSPLYEANHPKGIHPDTGKLTAFGIPENGEDGRTGFNAWRAGFWAQHHRRESYVFRQEINRRVRAGDISPEQAKTLWDIAHQKIVDNQKHLATLREKRQIERKAVKDAKDEVKRETGDS